MSSEHPKAESHEQRVIRLLSMLAEAVEPVSCDETWSRDDLAAAEELESGGFISAVITRMLQGQIASIDCMKIKPSGRAYLAELKKQATADTSVGFIKEHRFSFYRWFFGIVAAVVAALYVWYLTHH